jgi:hypothetical protein
LSFGRNGFRKQTQRTDSETHSETDSERSNQITKIRVREGRNV